MKKTPFVCTHKWIHGPNVYSDLFGQLIILHKLNSNINVSV